MSSLLFVAGDPSGDAHAAQLIQALRARDASLTFSGLGGPAMQQAGCELLDDLTAATSIGPFDATRHLGTFVRAKRLLRQDLSSHRPDLVILVDFGDFNLPVIAPLVKRFNIPIAYYISPQLWAWGRFRLRYVRRYVDRMIVFFPFEETFYRKAGVPVTWVGHPLVESARPSISREEAAARIGLNPWRRTVGLLPGSRTDEVRRHLPLMLRAARRISWRMPGVQFVLLKAPGIERAMLQPLIDQMRADVLIAEGPAADTLQVMEVAVVASGTATLEAALCGVPMVVVYRTSWPTYVAARAVVRIPHIALVNVVAGRAIVPELVQRQATPRRVARAIMGLLQDDEQRGAVQRNLEEVKTWLGPPGAVNRAADTVLQMLRATADRS